MIISSTCLTAILQAVCISHSASSISFGLTSLNYNLQEFYNLIWYYSAIICRNYIIWFDILQLLTLLIWHPWTITCKKCVILFDILISFDLQELYHLIWHQSDMTCKSYIFWFDTIQLLFAVIISFDLIWHCWTMLNYDLQKLYNLIWHHSAIIRKNYIIWFDILELTVTCKI